MFIVQLLILQVMIFAGLVIALRKLMARHATTATAHLQGLSQDYLRKQDELKKRLEEAERHYQEQLVKAQEEAYQLKTQANREAEAARQQILEQARQEAQQMVQQAIRARESLQQELAQSVETRAVARACELLRTVLPEKLREVTHVHWMETLLKDGLLPVGHLESREKLGDAKVVSAFPLTAAQRQQLLERLRTALGHPVTLQETVDANLVAGLVVSLGHLVLDGSLASKLSEAARHAQDRIE